MLRFLQVTLPDNEAHIWLAETGLPPHPSLFDLLSPPERARHARFLFEQGRNEFLISHALVRNTLSQYAPVAPRDWHFETNAYGCPHIAAPAHGAWLRFNLSHTRELSAVIVARGIDVGVDVEHMERASDLHALAARFFAPAEAAQVRTASDFFTFWTLKESYIKARGMGLSLPLDGFAFHLAPGAAPAISFTSKIEDHPAQWRFLSIQPAPKHKLAAAIRASAPFTIRIFPSGEAFHLE